MLVSALTVSPPLAFQAENEVLSCVFLYLLYFSGLFLYLFCLAVPSHYVNKDLSFGRSKARFQHDTNVLEVWISVTNDLSHYILNYSFPRAAASSAVAA